MVWVCWRHLCGRQVVTREWSGPRGRLFLGSGVWPLASRATSALGGSELVPLCEEGGARWGPAPGLRPGEGRARPPCAGQVWERCPGRSPCWLSREAQLSGYCGVAATLGLCVPFPVVPVVWFGLCGECAATPVPSRLGFLGWHLCCPAGSRVVYGAGHVIDGAAPGRLGVSYTFICCACSLYQ